MPGGGYCDQFAVMGNSIEYICAAFSAGKDKEQARGSSDDKGKTLLHDGDPGKTICRPG